MSNSLRDSKAERINCADFSLPAGVATSNLGMVLQRGGEELILDRVSDRFTIGY